jgi:hypothetical protein
VTNGLVTRALSGSYLRMLTDQEGRWSPAALRRGLDKFERAVCIVSVDREHLALPRACSARLRAMKALTCVTRAREAYSEPSL